MVEIVGGSATVIMLFRKPWVTETIGMKPVHIQKEIDAFVGDRLLEAMWRESIWLVQDSIATAETIDDVVRYGLGLRYAQMGQFMTYRLGGGEAGMHHFLKLGWPVTGMAVDQTDGCAGWNDDLINMIADQSDAQADGKSIRELEEIRTTTSLIL